MNCEQYELSLSSGEPLSDEAKAHAAGCPSCQAFTLEVPGLVADASLPALSAAEKARLEGLPAAVLRGYRADQPRRSRARQLVSLALAASLGALVTSVVFKLMPHETQAAKTADAPLTQLVADQSDNGFEAALASDDGSDEESLEVSWPSINEGDVP